jgi:C4-dicarboxylate transporter DctM subunit
MNPISTGFIGICLLLALLFLGMPIGFGMMLIGFTGFIYLVGYKGAMAVLSIVPYGIISNYEYCVLPLFLLMANVCLHAGLGKSLFHLVYVWMGKMHGGLSSATIASCAIFAAASASSIATAVTLGMVAIPEMRRYNYDTSLATGCVAAGGSLGILIPPSGVLIIYGIITGQSIITLFVAGIIPGILLASMFIVMIYIRARLNPKLAPPGESTQFREKIMAIGQSFEMLLLILLIIVGLIVGLFTPTEAGGIGAFGAIVFSLIRKRLSWQGFKDSIIDTVKNTGMIFTIILGAFVFNSFLAVTTIPMELADMICGLGFPPLIIMLLIILTYLILGCFIDAMSMILLTIPIFLPLVTMLGYDPIWFGIIIVLVVEMAMITPPVGMNVYVIKGICPDVPINTIFRGVLPFVLVECIFATLLIAFPKIVLFLPGLSG